MKSAAEYHTLARGASYDLPGDDARLVIELQHQLLDASYARPGAFAERLVTILRERLGLVAATVYINCPEHDAFKLKAVEGFDASRYQSFLLKNPNYPSESCADPATAAIWQESPLDSTLFRDKRLIDGLSVAGIVAVPFGPADPAVVGYPSPLGAICCYIRNAKDIERVARVVASMSPLVGSLYMAAFERLLMAIREETVSRAAFSNSLSDVCYRVFEVAQKRSFFDTGAVWLLNPRRELLYLRNVLGNLRRRGERRLIDYEIRFHETQNPLLECFNTGEVVHHGAGTSSLNSRPFRTSRLVEDIGPTLHNGLLVPMRAGAEVKLGGQARPVLGVLTILNHYAEIDRSRHYLPFTWEDIRLLEFVSEILVVLVFQSLRNSDHEAEFERRIHGVKTNVGAVKSHLLQLEQRESISEKIDQRHRFYLPNCIEWLSELEQQVGRTDRIGRLEVTAKKTRVYADVIPQAFKQAKAAAQANGVRRFELRGQHTLSSASLRIPFVSADARALLTVFRNLFENSFKYVVDPRNPCIVEVSANYANPALPNTVELHYEDNGMGIPEDDYERVFHEGFRSAAAKRVNVQGQGIGLAECRTLVQKMNGTIACRNPTDGFNSHFVITLKVTEDQA